MLGSPAEGTYLSIGDVARKAKVHPTTASRFAQKLGFESYPDFRAQLRASYVADSSAGRIQRRLGRIAEGTVARSVIDGEVTALQAIPQHISQATVDTVVKSMIGASRVLVFGRGHSSALVSMMVQRLVRSGYEANGFGHVDWEAPEHLARLGKGDVLLVFSFRGLRREIERLLAYAKGVGAITVLIGDYVGTPVQEKPDLLLLAPRGERGEFQSLIVPVAICEILILELSRHDNGRSIRALENLAVVKESLSPKNGN